MVDKFKEFEKKLNSLSNKTNIKMHKKCLEELENIIADDEIPSFIASYEERIKYLSNNLGKETFHKSWFEKLTKANGLRSIRFVAVRNVRILYMIDDGIAFLLLAFEERQGHKKTEYSKFIKPANKRFEEGKELKVWIQNT